MTGNVRQTPPEPTCGTLWVTSDNSPTCDGTGPQKAPEGTEDMKSIDNLREYVLTAPSICSTTRAILVGYIDGIDKEVEEARDRDYRNGMEDGEMAAERDGWVRLPVDADGVPIHVGDVMELDSGAVEEVESMHYYGSGGWTTTTTHNATAMPSIIRHHHAPTVEDVLREFAQEMNENLGMYTGEVIDADEWRNADERTIAEYAVKLRLAGEE